MEITIIKKIFLTQEVSDGLSKDELQEEVNDIIDSHENLDDWDDLDWRGKSVYEVYDTYSGVTLLEFDK